MTTEAPRPATARAAALEAPAAGGAQRRGGFVTAALLGLGWLTALFAPLASPGRVLATRDVAVFHLPLRVDLARLAADGVPWWNPWLHGGEAVLSNPNYAAFYPPTWLVLLLPPAYALSVGLIFHAALGFAGAWRLLRHLGGGRTAAALGALGFTAGVMLPLGHVFTAFCALAWLPWAALAADLAFAAAPRRAARPLAACALALAATFLAGDPAVTLQTALLVACLAVARLPFARQRAGRWQPAPGAPGDGGARELGRLTRLGSRLAVVALAAALLAAVQLLPTVHRVSDSPRAGGLPAAQALDWSLHPGRLVETVFPHALGDPARYASGRYFGWPLHDRGYGYVPAIHPGLLLAVLGVAALVTGVPRRSAWALAAAVALLLALGRFTPVTPFLHAHLPGFGALRFPERFVSLTVAALVFAGALGWQRAWEAGRHRGRGGGRLREGLLAVVLAAVALGAAVAGWASILARPGRVAGWLAAASPAPLSEAGSRAAVDLLARNALSAAALAAAVLGLLLLLHRSTPGTPLRRLAPLLAVALLAGDLWIHGHRLLRTQPAAELTTPPPLAAAVEPGARLFTDDAVVRERELVRAVPGSDPALAPLRAQLARLDPYSGNLWGLSYALDDDFDLMLTAWGRHGLDALRAAWPQRAAVARITGAWNVGTLVLRRPLAERRRELAAGLPSPAVEVLRNPYRLPRLRFVPRVRFHPDVATARSALAAAGWRAGEEEHWVGSPRSGEETADRLTAASTPGPPPTLSDVHEGAAELTLRYRAGGVAPLVWAVTYDAGWRARLDGEELPLHPTALGQIGALLPAGEHRLRLVYRDSLVLWGAAVTLPALLVALSLLAGLPWRRPSQGELPTGDPEAGA